MCPIRLMLVDDHELFRTGLRRLLEAEPDIDIVGEAGDGWSAQALAEQVRPNVVLMDLSLPLTNGIAATEAIAIFWRESAVEHSPYHETTGAHQARPPALFSEYIDQSAIDLSAYATDPAASTWHGTPAIVPQPAQVRKETLQ